MAKSMLGSIGKSFVYGLGRQAGFRTWKQLEKEAAKKVIDPNSKLRKHIQRFTLPGTTKAAVSKVWTLIALFEEEYEMDNSLFQSNYMAGDMEFISKKIKAIERLCVTQDDMDLYHHLRDSFLRIVNNG
jgi:hypothetical protein